MKPITFHIAIAAVVAVSAVLVEPSVVTGQKKTERYIPIGQSPGVSNRTSVIGTIQGYDAARNVLTITGQTGTIAVSITDRTRIWLDRSKIRKTNLIGDSASLGKGRRAEVKFENAKRKQFADWIKVEVTNPE